MNFLQKTLLTALPCVMLNMMPQAAMADDNIANLINKFSTAQTSSFQEPTASVNSNTFAQTANNFQNNFSSKASNLIATAKNFIGLPYRFGGTSPTSGFDCSGFMQYVYKQTYNISLPRTSGDMSRVGEKVSRDSLQPGDMVFFSHSGGRISHVGMYIGEGRFIHSPSTGKSISITALNSGYWADKFVTARRVINA